MWIVYTLYAISLALMIISVANMFRLSKFSRYMRKEIDRVYDERIAGNRIIDYPNISASYDNLKWYKPFDYKFERMVVYDASPY